MQFNLAKRLKEDGILKNSLIEIVMELEDYDTNQMVRMLVLLDVFAGKNKNGTIEGITKLAIFDFMLKYPFALYQMIHFEKNSNIHIPQKINIDLQSYEINSIEAKMMKFNFAPWDYKYRRVVSILTSKQLISLKTENKKMNLSITSNGINIVNKLYQNSFYKDLGKKSIIIKRLFGIWSQKKLVERIYTVFPETLQLKTRMDVIK